MPGESGGGGGGGGAHHATKLHGKNIKEDDSMETGDGAKNASFSAAIGSKDDPSLLAERKFYQANAVAPGALSGHKKTVDEKTTYDVLGDREA